MDDRLDPHEMRGVLRNVAAYRHLRQEVRRKANWGLGLGAFMCVIWYFLFGQRGDYSSPFSITYLGLACLEFGAALINKVFPSAEGVLIDGIVLFGFGGVNLARAILRLQAGGGPDWFYIVFGAYWMFAGFGHVRSYLALRRAFARRPSSEHLRWFDDLLRDIRAADPENDPTALDLATRPPVRGKLLGDTAFFLQAGSDDVLIAAREDVEIERDAGKGRGPVGYLIVEGADLGGFPLDRENWKNYADWKTRGGQPPPPMPPVPADDQ
jgi:hypothetical protein